jgi:small-conductance mechanosensitive channel
MKNKSKFKVGDLVKVIEDSAVRGLEQTFLPRNAHGIVVDVRVMSVSVRLAGFSHNRPYHVQDLELVARA